MQCFKVRGQSRKPTTQKNSCSWNHGDASFTSMFILTSGSICKWIPIARVLSRIKVQSQRIRVVTQESHLGPVISLSGIYIISLFLELFLHTLYRDPPQCNKYLTKFPWHYPNILTIIKVLYSHDAIL